MTDAMQTGNQRMRNGLFALRLAKAKGKFPPEGETEF